MTHYSNNPAMVRVDRFKPSGKWYDTFAIDMTGEYEGAIHTKLQNAFKRQYPDFKLSDGWILVCLEPYHEHSHPIILNSL